MGDLHPLQDRAHALAARIGAPRGAATIFRASPQDGRPHAAPDGAGFRLIVEERGRVLEERRVPDGDALLYALFRDVTFDMAQAEAPRAAPRAGEDPRRALFARQMALMEALSPDWAARLSEEIAGVLQGAPFEDR